MRRLVMAAAAALIVAGGSISVSAMTRGEMRDMETAWAVASCAKQYLGRPNSGPNTEVWIMCLHVSSELAQRDKIRVAEVVLKEQGYNVFEVEKAPGWFDAIPEPRSLTPDLVARIRRGD